jgi:hypothetical protein
MINLATCCLCADGLAGVLVPWRSANHLLQFLCQHTPFFLIQELPDLDLPSLKGHRQAPRVPGYRRLLQRYPRPYTWAFPVFLWLMASLLHADDLSTDSNHLAQLAAQQTTVKGNPQ